MTTTNSHLLVRALSLVAVLLSISLIAGCGPRMYPVEGTVVWKDGKPATELKNGFVTFELPEKQVSARGTIKDDGTFRLATGSNDGAFPGEYKVLVVEIGRKALGGPDASAIAPGAMDAKFSDPSTSPLKATIEPKSNKITLTVERSEK